MNILTKFLLFILRGIYNLILFCLKKSFVNLEFLTLFIIVETVGLSRLKML